MKTVIADLHCHPTSKPYSRSFPARKYTDKTTDKRSIYYYDSQTIWDKIKNKFIGLTTFSQTNFTALKYGGVNVVFATLYPVEKGFCRTNIGNGPIADMGINLATGYGKHRVNFIQELENGYFDDLKEEYEYLLYLNGKEITVDGRKIKYKLISNFNDIELYEPATEHEAPGTFIINVLVSIEGAHSFYSDFKDIGSKTKKVKQQVLDNVATVKSWAHRPMFITLGHHFWNGMHGHARSLTSFPVSLTSNQEYGLDEDLNDFGKEVVRLLLDNTKGNRILIDLKHMNIQSRNSYYAMLDSEYAGENIPLVVSHGAVTGNETNSHLFIDEPINFTDAEIIRIAKSKGLFGIQLDERRIASKAEVKQFKSHYAPRKVLFHGAELIWRQILHIARVLDDAGLFAWGIQCIGSDYDGIVNPIDGIWTSEDFTRMEPYLMMNAYTYFNDPKRDKFKNHHNEMTSPEEIVSRFMGNNTYDFISSNFI